MNKLFLIALMAVLALSLGLLIACGSSSNKSSSAAQPEGACCVQTTCSITSQAACSGGHWLGGNTVCAPNPCAVSDDDNDDDGSPDDDDNDNDNDDDDTTGESVWTDTTTGHMWQNGATVGANYYEWTAAQNYCAGLSWGGYSGWHLPDIDESRSLIRGCTAAETGGSCGVTDSCLESSCTSAACNGCSGLDGPGPGGAYWPPEVSGKATWYWSASAVAGGPGGAWGVSFSGGTIAVLYDDLSLCARCVR
jgi:hypothetical protein